MYYDQNFLNQLSLQKNRIIHAKIISLQMDEHPIETIEGRVTAGSINIDGASAIRRTCSLTIIPKEVDFSSYYWGLHTKFNLQIGLENHVDKSYPDIIWFDQGIYLITNFSQAFSTNNFTINISGKDKMSQLNGELGGTLNSSVDFGKIEETDKNGNTLYTQIPVKQIIKEMVHQYGGEPFYNIIVNDLDEMGLQLKEYAYDIPLYLFRDVEDESSVYINGTLNGKQNCWIEVDKTYTKTTIDDSLNIVYENLIEPLESLSLLPTQIQLTPGGKSYYVTKIVYGQVAGYTETDLTYPGDLIANIGESITSVLDKIKTFLGDFEYFYNLQGQFVFQKKKEWLNDSWNPFVTNEGESTYIDELMVSNRYSYIFNNTETFTAFNNTPNFAELKNDFTVWGTNTANLPIHMRYAIDSKPQRYTSISVTDEELQDYNELYGFVLIGQDSVTYEASDSYYIEDGIVYCDWREIIYQMSEDYRKYNHLDDFEIRVAMANPNLYPLGKTGYEQYYIDLEGFWRQLYNPEKQYVPAYITEFEDEKIYYIKNPNPYIPSEKLPMLNDHKKYYIETEEGKYVRVVYPFPNHQVYYIKDREYIVNTLPFDETQSYYVRSDEYYYPSDEDKELANTNYNTAYFWSKNITDNPESLLFWFDFLDEKGELDQFSVKAIGSRQKVTNDNTVKAIYYRDVPKIIFRTFDKDLKELEGKQTGYKYFNVTSNLEKMFYTSSQGKSAKDAINTLLYNNAYIIESVSITTVPIYYLEPNIRIYISDIESGIEGEYIASKYTIPLTYNGTMNITATKAATRLL